ncbi:MAG: methyltransferase domain-containing protein [Candidatus Sumerlaeota bacterium]|nr:methyltransferase domain-containing protein [Candidatus Sumerlaeota bacterium]
MISTAGLSLFLRQTIGAFHSTGAVCPSSPFLARAMVAPLRERAGGRRLRVLEAGPGTGVFSRQILAHLRRGDELDMVELNPRFAQWLREWTDGLDKRGPEARVHEQDILRFQSDARYDAVICGLPFNNFSPALVDSIFQRFADLTRPGADIVFFQYLGIRRLKGAFVGREERERLREVGRVIDGWIAKHGRGVERVWLNVPPAGAFRLKK